MSERSGGGSGVIISADGYGLTNFMSSPTCWTTRRGPGRHGRTASSIPLKVLGIDPTGDVAMFRLTRDRER